ncbi:MAG: HD domain-containing phosphohydrolase [Candidatus Izemoplasmatales bacterium]|jgi:diguanylate cyclase (GGDEF)-like protein/PAS domain S-box-containing protein
MMRNTLLIAFLYILILISAGLGVYFVSSGVIKDNQERLLTLERERVSLEIEHHFHNIETILLDLEVYVKTHNDDVLLLDYLTGIQENSTIMFSIYLGRPDKTMVNSSGFVPGPGFDLTTRIWYQLAIGSESIVFTPAFLNATEDRLIVTVAKAVYNDDESLIGVIATDVDINVISELVAQASIGETGYAFLIDNNDILLGYPEMDMETVSLVSADVFNENLDELAGSGTVLDIMIQDDAGVLSYTSFAYNNYLLGVFMPQAEFSQSSTLFSTLLLIFGIVLLISSFFFYTVYVRHVSLPLNHLLDDILKINIESNPEFRLNQDGQQGYQNIRVALNRVLETTSRYLNENRAIQDHLTLDNQRVKLLMESAADIIFEIDSSKRFVSLFGRGLKNIGKPASEFIGKTVLDCFGSDGIERDIVYTKALNGEHMVYDWVYEQNGTKLYYESTISPIFDSNEKVVGAVGISRDITEPMKRQKEIEHISNHDYLTGIYNRRFFSMELARLDNPANLPLGLILLDMNALKMFNDAFGHDVGDLALKTIATTIRDLLKEPQVVARTGGDEFAVIYPQATEEKLEELIADIKTILLRQPLHGVPLSVAFGYALKKSMGDEIDSLMKVAENDMYTNKINEGKAIRNMAIEAIMDTIFKLYPEEKVHAERVSELAVEIGKHLNLSNEELEVLAKASYYHDIGKIGVASGILYKPSSLTPKEYNIVKGHSENGYHLLRGAIDYAKYAETALFHHERWDGKGYPSQATEDKIPLFARIVAITDAYEAMTSDRPYRKRLAKEAALAEIRDNAGSQFDPKLAVIFLEKVAPNI